MRNAVALLFVSCCLCAAEAHGQIGPVDRLDVKVDGHGR